MKRQSHALRHRISPSTSERANIMETASSRKASSLIILVSLVLCVGALASPTHAADDHVPVVATVVSAMSPISGSPEFASTRLPQA